MNKPVGDWFACC